MNKKRILCFGDSNTWGYIPGSDHERYPENIRYPKVLQKLLGSKFEVIEEGLNSRTLVSEDKRLGKEGRNGSKYLIPCLDSQDPLDLVILMLGTNELKEEYKKSPKQIADLFEKHFVRIILNREPQFRDKYPKLIIIGLPPVDEKKAFEKFVGATKKVKPLNQLYSEIAEKNKCFFVDGGNLTVGSDGVHLAKEGHFKLADILYKKIRTIHL